MSQEKRIKEKEVREQEKLGRISKSQERQRASDEQVYGEGSQLLSMQKSSSGGDARGGIWDISTDSYTQPERNETGQNSNINDDGIDSIGAGGESAGAGAGAGGIPDGFTEETFDVVEDDNTAGQRIFLTKEVP